MSPRGAMVVAGLFAAMILLLFSRPVRLLSGHYYRWWADQVDPPPSHPVDVYENSFNICRTRQRQLEDERRNLLDELEKARAEIKDLKTKVPPPELVGPEPRHLNYLLECPWPPSGGFSFDRDRPTETKMVFVKDQWGRWICTDPIRK